MADADMSYPRQSASNRLYEFCACTPPSFWYLDVLLSYMARCSWNRYRGVQAVPRLTLFRMMWDQMCLLSGDDTGLDGLEGAKRGAGENDIPGQIPADVAQLWICGILASAILPIAAVGAALDELETLLRAVP